MQQNALYILLKSKYKCTDKAKRAICPTSFGAVNLGICVLINFVSGGGVI